MTWTSKPLAQVADLCLGKMLDEKKNKGDLMPYLANVNVRWGEFDLDNLREMRFEPHELERYGIMYGDIVMCEGGEPGRCAIWKDDVPGMMIQKALHRIRPKEELDHRFLYYAFLKKGRNNEFSGLFTGATIKHLPGQNLAKVEVRYPSRPEQERIADVLTAYDDLIENNRRRIALLEQSARLLYREWFVHLRFPGHEHVKVMNGVPEGWVLCSAFDAMDVMSGGTPKTDVSDYWHGEIPFFTPKDAVDAPYVLDTEKHLTDRGLAACNSRLYPKDTIFITARGTVGNLNLAQAPMAMNQSCYALKGKDDLSQFFLFNALKEGVQQFKSRAGGAVFDAIVVNTFKLIPFLRPPQELVREYTETVDPMFNQIDRLLLQSAKLREARDLLLPRLMSGNLVV